MKHRSFFTIAFLLLTVHSLFAQQKEQPIIQLKEVRDTILGSRSLVLPDPFDAKKAMLALFPGKYYNLSEKNYKNELISWRCKGCTVKTYPDVNGVEEDPQFPFSNGVATRLINVMDIGDSKGGKYKYIAFSHSVYDEEGLLTGRFSGGLLGLAKFTFTNGSWVLRSFDPAIAAYGAFSSCPTPKPLLIGEDQYAFLIKHTNGGGGGPFGSNYYLIAGVNGAYREIMQAYDVELSDTEDKESSWTSEIAVLPGEKKYFRDIVVTIKGTYYAPAEKGAEIEVPRDAQDYLKGKGNCKFVITRKYTYTAKGYEQKEASTVSISK